MGLDDAAICTLNSTFDQGFDQSVGGADSTGKLSVAFESFIKTDPIRI